MNREIRFRGKRTDNGEWVFGYLTEGFTHNAPAKDGRGTSGKLVYFISFHHVDPEKMGVLTKKPLETIKSCMVDPKTIGQLWRKSNIAIYEGDILEINNESRQTTMRGTLICEDGIWKLKNEKASEGRSYTECVEYWNDGEHNWYSLEQTNIADCSVIGNIH